MAKQHKSYAGLRYARKEIASLVPPTMKFVEPFAGHAWVSREVCDTKAKVCILGDIQREPLEWVKKMHRIKNAKLIQQDWRETIKECRDPNSICLIDPPWDKCYEAWKGNCDDFREEILKRVREIPNVIITLNPSTENIAVSYTHLSLPTNQTV